MIRLAIVGNGERAARHRVALAGLEGVEVVAVVEPGSESALQEVLARPDVDAVDLCAPPGPAMELAIASGRAGKRVIAEHPPALSAADFARVQAACREHGGSLELLLPERCQPLPRELKATLAAGKLGALRYVHAASIRPGPATGGAAGGGRDIPPGETAAAFVVEHATGALDLVAWLFGDVPVTTVFTRSCSLSEGDASSRYASTVLSFADASQAIVEIGVASDFPAHGGVQRLALTGMRGSAYFTDRDHDVVIGANGVRPLVDDAADGLTAAFSAWLANGAADGASAARLAFAAAESVRTGQPVGIG